MLVLKKIESGVSYNLMLKTEHLVGRFGCLRPENDMSISREHALIRVSVENGEWKANVTDTDSKFGTFINDGIQSVRRIPNRTPITLNVGDRIQFGRFDFSFVVENEPLLVVYVSLTTSVDKSFMTKALKKLGGKTVTEWSNSCTHYTTNSFKITNTLAQALACGKPIVTVDYWKHFVISFAGNKGQLPNYADFLPSNTDSLIQQTRFNIQVNLNRRNLFKNINFISFVSAQRVELLPVIEAAGGTIEDASSCRVPETKLLAENVIVLQPKNSKDVKRNVTNYLDILKKHKKRPVRDIEVRMSIVDNSTKKYCNPNHDVTDLLSNDDLSVIEDDESIMTACSELIDLTEENGPGSNISLTVKDVAQIDGSDDESVDVIEDSDDESVDMIEDSLIRNSRRASKRKLEQPVENPAKNSRLDMYFAEEKTVTDSQFLCQNSKSNSASYFHNNITKKNNVSSSLFDSTANRKQSSNNIFSDSNNGNLTSSLFDKSKTSSGLYNKNTKRYSFGQNSKGNTDADFDTVPKESSNTSNLANKVPRSSSKDLFARLGKKNETPALLASLKSSEQSTLKLGNKRKLVDETVASTSNKTSKGLFDHEILNKKTRLMENSLNSDSDDECTPNANSTILLPPKPRKKTEPVAVVNVPTTVLLNEFKDVASRKYKVKNEPLDVSTEIQSLLDKTIILTVSLVKHESRVSQLVHCKNDSQLNFKKFRKNETKIANRIIPITSLQFYEPRHDLEFLGDE